jgi:hypothetical protein
MILGPDGNPLSPQNPESLPLVIEAIVESKVNTALDRIREDNRQYQRDATIRGWIKFASWSLVGFGFFVLIDLYGPDKVEEWTEKYVKENMNQPMLTRSADNIMRDRMAQYIDGKLSEVTTRVGILDQNLKDYESNIQQISKEFHNIANSVTEKLNDIEVDLSEKIIIAQDKLQDLSDQIIRASNVLESLKLEQEFLSLVSRAEINEYDAFLELIRISNDNNNFSKQAAIVLSSIQRRLEADRANMVELIPAEQLSDYTYKGSFTNDEIYEQMKKV